MSEVILKKSSKAGKKYDAVIDGKKTVSFGATGFSDFTKHKDEERKQASLNKKRASLNKKRALIKQTPLRLNLY